MSNTLFVIAMSFGVVSLMFSFMAMSRAKKARKMLDDSLKNLRAAEQIREQASRMINGNPEGYQDLSSGSGPRYREYGDLS